MERRTRNVVQNCGTQSRRQALARLGALVGAATAHGQGGVDFRLALSESLVGDVNINDARAAMSVWIHLIMKEMNVVVRFNPNIFESPDRLSTLLRAQQMDTVAVSIPEYRRMGDLLDTKNVVVPYRKLKLEYALLVRAESGITKLADLKGRRLVALHAPPTCLAPTWVSNVLESLEPKGASRFFGSIIQESRPARVLLPVFFGQVDACLTTVDSFLTMSELNPQLARRLRILATSPEVMHSVYAFRKGWSMDSRRPLERALANLAGTAAGRQVLTLFQIDRLQVREAGCLRESLAILEQAERGGRKPGFGLETPS
jgi:hypothetical protein